MSSNRPLGIAVIGHAVPDSLSRQLASPSFASVPVRHLPASAATTASLPSLVRTCRADWPEHDILVVGAHCHWPEFALARIDRARQSLATGCVLSPLTSEQPALNPLPAGITINASNADLDSLLAQMAPTELQPVNSFQIGCSVWTPGAELSESPDCLALSDCLIDAARTQWIGAELPADRRELPPANALASLRARLQAEWLQGSLPARQPRYPGVDGQCVYLHILHGWGGGAEQFVVDFARARSNEHHLLLRAHGDSGRRCYGETISLALIEANEIRELGRWPLLPSIADTAIAHTGYRQRLRALVSAYGVQRIMVSSLIGHSLDVFKLDLPTVNVSHDYYPLWPVLHENFDSPSVDASREALQQSLQTKPHPFATHTADYWLSLRQNLIDSLCTRAIPGVVPSASVARNLARIAPALAKPLLIAHGLPRFASRPTLQPRAGKGLRILVLGRINGDKGERLLRQVLPRLCEHHSVWLLGCGKSGEAFFGQRQVHVLLNYERADLPALLQQVQADFALMPVTVSESFSFTLSELWALGVVPVASRLGSLGERIRDGETGVLFDPEPEQLLATVEALAQDRTHLNTLRQNIAALPFRDSAEMRADYEVLFAAPLATKTQASQSAPLLADAHQAIAEQFLRASAEQRYWQQSANALALESKRRAEWGFSLDRQIREQQKQHELATAGLQNAVADHARQISERNLWVEILETERARLAELLQAEQKQLSDAHAGWSREVDRLEAERSRFERDLNALYQSTSWRITSPMRHMIVRVRAWRSRLGYGWSRLLGNLRRLQGYWRRHGASAALERARQEFSSGEPKVQAILPGEPQATPLIDLQFPEQTGTPQASIIIPVYNKFAYTAACLASLQQEGAQLSFEVIVVDDGSSDETEDSLKAVPGLRYHRNAENLGFVGACNAGAALARGDFLVFLNNDTVVRPGWLDALIQTFNQHERVGLVGAKLVYPDGRLQEAGGIIFADGSGWNYGRFGDPSNPAFNYVREVDYCSGAAIAIARELFQTLGCFDQRYAPAYYEDTDLAFKVREHGLRVMYQPASVVIHFEGITSGTDTSSGTKRYQVVNQGKFLERWQTALAKQPKPGSDIEFAKEHRVKGRILIIDATTPEPDKDSGSVRLVNVMKSLIELGYKPTFFAENRLFLNGYSDALQALGVEVLFGTWLDPINLLRAHGSRFKAIFVSRHYVLGPLLKVIRDYAPRAQLIFDTVDLHYLRERRAAELAQSQEQLRSAAKTQMAELRLIRASDITLVVSPVEKALLAKELPDARVEILSNVHEVAGPGPGFAERHDLYFVGGFQHDPNVDAMLWFARSIWPLISPKLPGVRFHIVGSRMPESIRELASESIVVHGYVPSMQPFLDGYRLSVAPLRYGAGVKGKVNQSMAHGQPVVATTIAAEGMNLKDEQDVLIADDAERFAAAVVRLYQDQALWERLAANGLHNIEQHFSVETAKLTLKNLLPP